MTDSDEDQRPHEADWRIGTRVVHEGRAVDPETGAVTPPIHLSTTFARDDDGELLGEYGYSRYQNPNRQALELCLSGLEGGDASAAFASGSAAANTVLQALGPGDRVLYSADLYHGVRSLMETVAERSGISCRPVDLLDAAATDQALSAGAAVVWCETPTNPQLQVIDVEALANRCRAAGVLLVVDNTFATPVLQRPLELGADLVVHATTKYLAGHSDVTGGMLVTGNADSELWDRILTLQRHGGAVPSPFDCWLALRGIATLAVRMRQHVDNAEEIARRLESHPAVIETLYPGLPSHPGHAIARRQMGRPGGVLSFRVAGGEAGARRFTSRLAWLPRATSLGGVHTLVEHRALVEPDDSPVPRDLIRVSVGIEDKEDVWADIEAGLTGD